MTTEAEEGEGDQRIGGLESERDPGDQPDLGVDSISPLDRLCSIAARILALCLTMLLASFTNDGMRQRRAQLIHRSRASTAAS